MNVQLPREALNKILISKSSWEGEGVEQIDRIDIQTIHTLSPHLLWPAGTADILRSYSAPTRCEAKHHESLLLIFVCADCMMGLAVVNNFKSCRHFVLLLSAAV